jgi:hypothetical protein
MQKFLIITTVFCRFIQFKIPLYALYNGSEVLFKKVENNIAYFESVLNTLAMIKSPAIIRVHYVKEAVEVVQLTTQLKH